MQPKAPTYWLPGDTVVLREVWREQTWSLRPATVVEDAPDRIAFWIPRGTRWKAPTTPPHRVPAPTRAERLALNMTLGDWALADREWDVDSIWLARPGALHAVWCSWLPDGSQYGWYINLQTPFVRTANGFDWMDLMLDIVVEPDFAWRWKDEDEFEAMISAGHLDNAGAELVRAEAAALLRDLEERRPPFSEPWPRWRPDPAWPRPALPGT